ncbi:splicing factor, suppressor of white-apricot homolog isoform X2 [Neltuma alba]|uniref:splicing factor, suppressor of white-apricot homolog isoform X2 n=1 Tax=Neltuma alba TaxID=207710 RepID=UPI0010A3FD81|nr:splicing factor, suppressor of white-apricot homolog isoform X2 [Prosopis alba]
MLLLSGTPSRSIATTSATCSLALFHRVSSAMLFITPMLLLRLSRRIWTMNVILICLHLPRNKSKIRRMQCNLLQFLCQNTNTDTELMVSRGYHAVGFSYGNTEKAIETKDNGTDSGFHLHFPVPEGLLSNLPPNEKVHQIIARTAMFVCKHGGQSEIILRVKQGDNPTFGFLMPDHHLHAYFRFLVDHQELLKPGIDDGNSSGDKNDNQGLDQTGGALSLLGSVYGSGDDDDGIADRTPELKGNEYEEVFSDIKTCSQGTEQAEPSPDEVKKDGSTSKNSISTSKEKVPVIKRNHSINTFKAATAAKAKKVDALGSLSNAADKSLTTLPGTTKVEKPIVEPPSDLKRVIEKIVEFILKNGKEFESVLAEQDRAHGRFPFLLPSNQYHPYYIKVLQTAQESKSLGKGFPLEKHDPAGRMGDNRPAHKESVNLSVGSIGSDLPYDIDRKEKFKMVIGKSKKDGQEPTSKDSQPHMGVSMDAAAAAAILQAATRGIKNPSLEILTKTSSGNGQGLGSDGGHLSGLGSLLSYQPPSSVQKSKQNAEASVSVPVAKVIAETAAIAAAGEADSSEASMSKEQKLKAERLKRAKMFAAMIKSGAAPLKSEPVRGLSADPPGSGVSGSGAEIGNLVGKEREGSSVPQEVDNSDKSPKSAEKLFVDNTERRSKRKYRSRSSRHEEEEEKEDKKDHKRSKRKHRSHGSSHGSRDRHKHKRRHSFSKDRDSKRTKHDSSSDDESHHSRDYHKYDSSADEKHHSSRRRRRESNSSDDEHEHSRQRRQCSSSDGEHRHRHRTGKHRSRSQADRDRDLEEGEVNMKPDQLRAIEDRSTSREASVDLSKSYLRSTEPSQPSETTDVSDELRAKIRAMLMATL